MIKHYCDRCFKFIPTYDIKTITFGANYEFCKECYNKVFDFCFKKEVEKDES